MNIVQKVATVVGLIIVVAAVMSLPVMLLWDWLMPEIFGLKEISWLQAWGLMFLSGLLFRSTSLKD